jgi:DNA-binding SARP family transcriptional activator
LEAAAGPLVQLWGWPGCGKRLFLSELLRRGGLEVPPASLNDPHRLRQAIEAARQGGHPWLICRSWPAAGPPRALDELLSKPLLVFSSADPRPLTLAASSTLGPETFLLEPQEARALWRAEAGEALSPARFEELWSWLGGWYRPWRILARHGAQGGPPDDLSLPELERFVHREVLGNGEVFGSGAESSEERLRALGFAEPHLMPELLRRRLRQSPEAHRKGLRRVFPGVAGTPETTTAEPETGFPTVVSTVVSGVAGTPEGGGGEGEPEARFQVQLLGAPRVFRCAGEGQEEVRWTLRRAFKIFAYLSSRAERCASRAELVEVGFGDEDRAAERRNFHPTLSLLRRNLQGEGGRGFETLIFRNGTYRLSPEVAWDIDVERFLAGASRMSALLGAGEARAAADLGVSLWPLYRGPFLAGEEEAWVIERREEAQRAYLTFLRQLGEAHRLLGRSQQALDAFRAALIEDPLQEAIQVEVMGLYAEQGRRDLTRRQYNRLSKLLIEELGVEPLPETTLEYHRLMG